MALRLQDPENATAPYLLESLLEACKGATSGVGLFAWATGTGLELLLRDPTFQSFTSKAPFDLVVGMDIVTDARALKTMQLISAESPRVQPRLFLHQRAGSVFHPKTSWFRRKGKGGTLVSGSGNLTVGGLRANWEAYSITELSESEAVKVDAHWRDFLARHTAKILLPDDLKAAERASKNTGWDARPRGKRRAEAGAVNTDTVPAAGPVEVIEADVTELLAQDSEVLVAEIPKASDRWNQANFDLRTYEDFFGAKVGSQRRILLQHVERDGSLGPMERRPSVEVKSRNFRFELQAASGVPYPKTGRPVAVFVRQLTGVLLYRLVMPIHREDYVAVTGLLDDLWSGRSDRMRRVTTDVSTLAKYWGEAPFWKVASTPE
jgi:hypothetical protein